MPPREGPTRLCPQRFGTIGTIMTRDERTKNGDSKTQSVDDTRLELAPGVRVKSDVVSWSYTSSRGPGGQNVNRRATRAVLRLNLVESGLRPGVVRRLLRNESRWVVDEGAALQIACEEHRSQRRNRQGCLEVLRAAIIRASVVPKPRKKTKPSRGAIERRLQDKREQAQRKARRGKLE